MKKKIKLLIYVILITSLLTTSLSACQENGNTGNGNPDSDVINIELLEGESLHLNHPVAYPYIQESQITSIEVIGPNEIFSLTRSKDYSNDFVFNYRISIQDEPIIYAPPITNAEDKFDYTTLYALENGDGYGTISRVSYLCAVLGAPYFSDRIPLPTAYTEEKALERARLLEKYGIIENECTQIKFEYSESDGTNNAHVIIIGKQIADNTGFYFCVDGRDYIYHTNMTHFSNAISDFKSFVSGRVVPKGLDEDSIYGPYLTTDFKLWTNDKLIVSFRFCNASERDPSDDSFFKNTLSNEYRLYSLDSGSCETVVKLLGGITTNGNTAEGLIGETVELGLTPRNMEKYNLYAHKIYFEMPRGIFDASEGTDQNSDELSDYGWLSTLGVNLYISPATYDENGNEIRYVGSDLFDIVVKVPAEDFEFLDYSFTEYWARNVE